MKDVSERHVQAVWYDAALRPAVLYTRRGSEVTVLSPGEWNRGPGPDFRGAVLEIGRERQRVTGDVEVHLCPSDWDFHGHGADPNYRNVVAHVTWRGGPVPPSLPNGAVSIWLGRFVTSDPRFSPSQIDLEAYPYARLPLEERPCQRLLANDPDLAERILLAAGRHRLRMKARRLAGRIGEALRAADAGRGGGGRVQCAYAAKRQVFYEEVMTALGYSRNAAAFRRIAELIPIAALPDETDAARNALLVASGFASLNRSGTRPRNAPERRLERAAEIFTATSTMSLASESDFSKGSCRRMALAMRGETRVTGEGRRERCMGAGRAAAIIANVVVPYAIAEERLSEPPPWLPPEDISEPVRLTAFRLFGRDHNPAAFYSGNGLKIQGLLQIHRDCCLTTHPRCDACSLMSRHGADAAFRR